MESVLRPRDIQTRIRAGESPEDVAAAAQTTLDRIMGFAAPVIAERAHIAQLAQKASVRRRVGNGPVGVLGEAVAARLESHRVDPDDVVWDAWRREDGRWTLVADYAAGGAPQQARFVYDVAGRYVVADDDEARELVGERTAPPPPPATAPTLVVPLQQADSTVLDDPEDIEDTGDIEEVAAEEPATDEVEPVVEHAAELPLWPDVDGGDESLTGDLTETSRAVQALLPPTTGDADWIVTQASERPVPATPPPPAREPVDALFEAPSAPQPDAEPEVEPARPARGSKSRRPAVPSWDEIMFGTPKD